MVRTGLDVFVDTMHRYRNRRVALLANQTSVTRDLKYSWDVLRAKGLSIQTVFSPEHGLFSTEQDQVAVQGQPQIDIEVVSLYGQDKDSLIPDGALLDDIDLVVCDVQDVGARYYTYVNTVALFMEVAAGRDVEMIILDRPNPLGGDGVEGPLLDAAYGSFVGVLPVAIRHGLTPGELALLYQKEKRLDVSLSVIRMEGWKRRMGYAEAGLPWVPPSPNMPTLETAWIYPGGCLFEGVNVSEGRGTTTPFQLVGAPFVDPQKLVHCLSAKQVEGVSFRPTYFKPVFHHYAGDVVGGVFIHVTDKNAFRPFLTGVAVVQALYELYGEKIKFLHDVYEFNTIHPAFDLLTGGPMTREMIVKRRNLEEIAASWQEDEAAFSEMKKGYHLYGD